MWKIQHISRLAYIIVAIICGLPYVPIILFLLFVSLYLKYIWQKVVVDSIGVFLILFVNLTEGRTLFFSFVLIYPIFLAIINNLILKIKLLNYYSIIILGVLTILSLIRLEEKIFILILVLFTTGFILLLNTLLNKNVRIMDNEAEYNLIHERALKNVLKNVKATTLTECFFMAGLTNILSNKIVEEPHQVIYKLSIVNQIFTRQENIRYYGELGGLRIYVYDIPLSHSEKTILREIGKLNDEYFTLQV